jgi:hypothetical protein
MRSFDYTIAARVHVAFHGANDPTDREWEAYLRHIGASLRDVDGIVGMTMGGGPNRAQRAYAVEFWKQQSKQPPIAVITPSMLVVRMAGALRWFMPTQIKAFSIHDVSGAFDYLGLDAKQRTAVTETIELLKRQIQRAAS